MTEKRERFCRYAKTDENVYFFKFSSVFADTVYFSLYEKENLITSNEMYLNKNFAHFHSHNVFISHK